MKQNNLQGVQKMNIRFESRKFNKGYGKINFKALQKLSFILIIISLLTPLFAGCKAQPTAVSDKYYYSFTDSLNNTVNLKDKPNRVVSLIGSYAETWILAGGTLAGVTSDVTSERKMELPKETKIVGTIKAPNVEEIIALQPDFVILSPDIESHVKISETLKKADIPFALFKVEHFDDYLNLLKICTDITGNKEMYNKNGVEVEKQIQRVLSEVDKQGEPSYLFIRAFSSGAKAQDDDNMAAKIFNDLGGINIATKQKSLLKDLSVEKIIEEDPNYIFVVTMGDSKEALQALRDGIEKNPAWSNLSTVENNRYIILPKELFHYKPNAKWGESYEYAAKILYPEKFK
jgi:iron complex transport system substrate-binding protein